MEGIQVFVCRFPWSKCLPCGVAAETYPEKWASLYCIGGWVEGNQIKVSHSYETLQFCEIQVFGTELGQSSKYLSKAPYSGDDSSWRPALCSKSASTRSC